MSGFYLKFTPARWCRAKKHRLAFQVAAAVVDTTATLAEAHEAVGFEAHTDDVILLI